MAALKGQRKWEQTPWRADRQSIKDPDPRALYAMLQSARDLAHDIRQSRVAEDEYGIPELGQVDNALELARHLTRSADTETILGHKAEKRAAKKAVQS